MATIGKINTIVSVTTAPFTSGLSRVGTAIKTFGSTLSGIGSKLATVAAPLAAFAAVAKTVHGTINAFGEIDSMAKLARSTGMSLESLTGLAHAADLSGVSFETLAKAQQKMTREGIDISVLADRIAAAGSATDRAKIAFGALGRQGADLLPLLEGGGDAIRTMASEGSRLAGVSMFDAGKIEQANDAITTLKLGLVGIVRGIAVEIAPAITSMASKIGGVSTFIKTAFKTVFPIVRQFGNVVGTVFSRVAEVGSIIFGELSGNGMSAFENIKNFAFNAFSVMEFGIQNSGPIAELLWTKLKLGAVGFFEDMKHLFTVKIPTVVSWMANNWRDIFTTIFDFTSTVFINLGKNIRAAMSAIWKFIKSGGRSGLNIAWTPLTEGFKNAIKEMPDIPERALTELEKKLKTSADVMGTNLSEGLAAHLKMRRAELLGEGMPDVAKIESNTTLGFSEDASASLSKIGDLEGVAAVQRGSGEAFSAIFKAMRGGDSQDKILKANEESLKQQKQQTAALKKIAMNPPVELVAGTA